jgi:hypothetical protein
MPCYNCGNYVDVGDRYCRYCGAEAKDIASSKISKTQPQSNIEPFNLNQWLVEHKPRFIFEITQQHVIKRDAVYYCNLFISFGLLLLLFFGWLRSDYMFSGKNVSLLAIYVKIVEWRADYVAYYGYSSAPLLFQSIIAFILTILCCVSAVLLVIYIFKLLDDPFRIGNSGYIAVNSIFVLIAATVLLMITMNTAKFRGGEIYLHIVELTAIPYIALVAALVYKLTFLRKLYETIWYVKNKDSNVISDSKEKKSTD